MTTPSHDRGPEADEDLPADAGPSQPGGTPGVELGMSDGPGSTFEPEEDAAPEG